MRRGGEGVTGRVFPGSGSVDVRDSRVLDPPPPPRGLRLNWAPARAGRYKYQLCYTPPPPVPPALLHPTIPSPSTRGHAKANTCTHTHMHTHTHTHTYMHTFRHHALTHAHTHTHTHTHMHTHTLTHTLTCTHLDIMC